jgi:hypothetical protein
MLCRNGRFDFSLTVLRKLRLEKFLKFSHTGDEAIKKAAEHASSAASAVDSDGGASVLSSKELDAEADMEETRLG